MLVFVVEGDAADRSLLRRCLDGAGYVVRMFSVANAIEEALRQRPLLMLIAARLPDGSGLELCRSIRQNPILARTRVVLLIDGTREEDHIAGFEYGADDCLSKPFSPTELEARVKAVLRSPLRPAPIAVAKPAEIVIDAAAMRLSVRGNEVTTTTLEFRLIDYLARHRGQVFTRDILLDTVWGEMAFVSPRSVDACVRRVREKIEPEQRHPTYLKTVRGVGYRFDAVAAWSRTSGTCGCESCAASIEPISLAEAGGIKRRRAASQS